jgi:methionyl-tRNA formyltransferase
VIAGDEVTGVSIMGVVQALDAGPVFATVTRPIGPDDTSVQVERDLATLGAELLVDTIDEIAEGRAFSVAQDDAGATYAHRIEKTEGLLDWSWPAGVIHNRVRGLQPWPMTWTWLDGRRLIVTETRLAEGADEPGAAPGTILGVLKEAVRVQTGDGAIDLVAVQPEGRRPMAARDFAAGHRIAPGARFTAGEAAAP